MSSPRGPLDTNHDHDSVDALNMHIVAVFKESHNSLTVLDRMLPIITEVIDQVKSMLKEKSPMENLQTLGQAIQGYVDRRSYPELDVEGRYKLSSFDSDEEVIVIDDMIAVLQKHGRQEITRGVVFSDIVKTILDASGPDNVWETYKIVKLFECLFTTEYHDKLEELLFEYRPSQETIDDTGHSTMLEEHRQFGIGTPGWKHFPKSDTGGLYQAIDGDLGHLVLATQFGRSQSAQQSRYDEDSGYEERVEKYVVHVTQPNSINLGFLPDVAYAMLFQTYGYSNNSYSEHNSLAKRNDDFVTLASRMEALTRLFGSGVIFLVAASYDQSWWCGKVSLDVVELVLDALPRIRESEMLLQWNKLADNMLEDKIPSKDDIDGKAALFKLRSGQTIAELLSLRYNRKRS